jgi:hypothetical protein
MTMYVVCGVRECVLVWIGGEEEFECNKKSISIYNYAFNSNYDNGADDAHSFDLFLLCA